MPSTSSRFQRVHSKKQKICMNEALKQPSANGEKDFKGLGKTSCRKYEIAARKATELVFCQGNLPCFL